MSSRKVRLFLVVLFTVFGLAIPISGDEQADKPLSQGCEVQSDDVHEQPECKEGPVSVTWNPERLEITSTPGTLRTVSVEFSANKNVLDAEVWIAPELRKFITSDVNSFSKLQAGTSYELSLVVSLPREIMDSGLRGSIRIRDKETHKSLPGRLPVSIIAVPPARTVANAPTTVADPTNERISTDVALSTTAFVNDEIDIFFAPTADNVAIDTLASSINGLFIGSIPDLRFYQLLVSPTDFNGLTALINTVKQNPAVSFVTPNVMLSSFAAPNDPGTAKSYAPALINAPLAWDITTGVKKLNDGSDLKIGAIDGVFDFTNADLAANIAFYTDNNVPLLMGGDHGTRVASIIGAVANNNIGIAGMMWNASLYLYSAGLACQPKVPWFPALGQGCYMDWPRMLLDMDQAINDQVRVVNLTMDFPAQPYCVLHKSWLC